MKARTWTWLPIVASLSLTACGKTIEWKQEVKLHDGRMIVVERQSKQKEISLPVKGVLEPWQQVTFTHPTTGERVIWELPNGLGLWMLDFEAHMVWAVLRPMSVSDYNEWGCPSPPWIVFRQKDGTWQQLAAAELPAKFSFPNTLAGAAADEPRSESKFVSAEKFRNYIAGLDPEYRTIGREKINPIAKGCVDDVLVKQGRQSEIDYRR